MTPSIVSESPFGGKPTATMSAEDIMEHWHQVATFPLDIAGAAAAFAEMYGYGERYDIVRPYPGFAYDPRAGVWREWRGCVGWTERDSILPEMTDIVIAMCGIHAHLRNIGEPADKVEIEYRKLRQRHIGPMVEKAIKLASVQCAVKEWDADPNIIGLPAGEYFYLTPTNPSVAVHDTIAEATDFVTKSMAATPTKQTDLWLNFLGAFTGGDKEYADALQIWTAAALLPNNAHHKAHVLYGDGNTGKSTYLKTIQAACGDYAGSARASIFTDEKSNHPAELLPFTEKRLVVLPELPRGALRSDLLKTVTGGDAISVRGMRQNPRTETPSATLFFSANELPSIRLVDNALKRRLLIWPCDHVPAHIDNQLAEKLATPRHLGGVVSWLRFGLRRFIQLQASGEGMPMPEAVQNATDEYFNEADVIGQWADTCTRDGGETPSTVLYQSFTAWCANHNRRPLSSQSFTLWLGRHYEKRHGMKGSYYPISLNQQYLPT